MLDESTGLKTINGNLGVTNTLNSTDFYTHVIHTCKQITEILENHCGPYATDALIIQDNTGTNLLDPHYAIFTKDGINIVKSIEFVSPIQKHIQNLVAYIGSRVDSLSHDGTTTAMLFFTLLVEDYFHRINQSTQKDTYIDRRKLKRDFLHVLEKITTIFNSDLVITIEQFAKDQKISNQEAISYVAYHQAMLSSKGDEELASAIVEVVETLPKELYGLFSVEQTGLETKKRFTVTRDTFNFVIPVVANLDDMNYRMGTEYIAETCDLLVSEDDLIRGNPSIDILIDHIFNAERGNLNQDLVVIAKSIDASLQSRINTFNRANKHKIITFPMSLYNPYSSKITILSAIMAVAGVYTISDHVIDPSLPYLIKDAHLHYKNKRLYISHLYEKDGSPYHPFFKERTAFPPYTLMVDSIRDELDGFASGRLRIESATDKARYRDYIEIYRRMISSDVRNLQLSGLRHDTMADRDVLQDSFGAVLSSLEHGFVFDAYLKFYVLLSQKNLDMDPTTQSIFFNVVTQILTYIHKKDAQIIYLVNDISDSTDITRQDISDKDIPTSVLSLTLNSVLQSVNKSLPRYLQYPVDRGSTTSVSLELNKDTTPVIQPADTYRELFTRIIDLLPKLLNTHRAIIPNTVNIGTTK